jgi:photosystem II stability/assembly factor-like uncharacterized protein
MHAPTGPTVGAVAMDGAGNVFAGLRSGGGLFVSSDDGASWHPSNAGMYTLDVDVVTATGSTVYVGAGNVLRSVDDGASWLQVTPLSSVGEVSAIAARGSIVAAGSSYDGTLYVSADGGQTFTQRYTGIGESVDIEILGTVILCATADGVVRSTDSGMTFGPAPGITAGAATLHCDGVSTCYAGANNTSTPATTVLLKSTDAGATWAPLGMNNVRIAAVTDSGTAYVNDGTSGDLIRSDDGGSSWTTVSWPHASCAIPFAARGDKVFAACVGGVYRSDDKAASWTAASGSAATGAISGHVSGVMVDTSSTALGADGDIYMNADALYRSTDDGETWQVMVPYAEPYYVPFGCFVTGQGALECLDDQGPLVRSTDHGVTWQTIAVNPPGTPGPMQVQVSLAANLGSTVYAGGSEGMARSDDDGLTFQLLNGSPQATALQLLHNGHLLVQGATQTFRSVDQGVTWKALANYLQLPVLEDASGRLVDVSGSQYSIDEGDSWTFFPGGGRLPSSRIKASAIDGSGRLVAIVAPGANPFTNLGQPPVTYTSTDGGTTWTLLQPQIPNPEVNAFAVDRKGRLLAATAGGLYRLDPAGPAGP